ncbi:alcohol dehydrogenase family protein [Paralimibaculum aggregatum]|uniref:Alcohol dehydrogenase family protein n=1 Tax=Paralimibaculum aggregatum TaxID=3036245 RepID=A0ABQ6LQP6_9RHOB|nr:alcohol dehydrogenase family protein [Limibaculum sp. NKW23]GMG83938.1 alcohol dehydrogenase family protein [Limibaculum sp. NKW23]
MTIEIPERMRAVLLTGHGGPETLEYREDVPVPRPGPGAVLIRVGAAGINNTDINTRIGWYSKAVSGDTESAAGSLAAEDADASWTGRPLVFPRIQGADCCGEIVAVGAGVPEARIGERVLVASLQPAADAAHPWDFITFGSECDGAFAEYTTARSDQTHRISSALTDAELASFPCACSTAENLIARAGCNAEDTVLITGASGGVGSAAVQLCRRRGARVIAMAGRAKHDVIAGLGAERLLDRGEDPAAALGAESVSLVVDLVAGETFPALIACLKRGGRYATAGAIGGPITTLDVRDLYLKDLSFFGATAQAAETMPNLVAYIERGEIRPLVAGTFPLAEIHAAQALFLKKTFVGKLVLLP